MIRMTTSDDDEDAHSFRSSRLNIDDEVECSRWITKISILGWMTRLNITPDFWDDNSWMDDEVEHSSMNDQVEPSPAMTKMIILGWMTEMNIISDFPEWTFSDGWPRWTLLSEMNINPDFPEWTFSDRWSGWTFLPIFQVVHSRTMTKMTILGWRTQMNLPSDRPRYPFPYHNLTFMLTL